MLYQFKKIVQWQDNFYYGRFPRILKIWAEAFLKRGDIVAATVRNLDTLSELSQQYGDALLPIQLDVTNREAAFAAINQAKAHFVQIDVVINNAGYGLFGTIE